MTDGDTELLDERTIEAFRTTGLAHLVAVSGANVAVVLVVVVLLTRALIPRGRWLRALAAIPPLVFFAFLTGLEASVLRAVITAGVALALTAEGRAADALRLSALAFVVLVLATPDVLFRPGFQLSFGATLGIVLWANSLTDRIQRFLPDGRVWRGLAVGAATTATAQGAVAPILAWHFGRIPAFGGVANLVAVPIAPFVTVGGLITLSLGSVVPFARWTPALMRAPLDLILLVARSFARLPASSVAADVGVGIAITGLVAAAVVRSKRVRVAAIGVAIVAATTSAGHAAARPSCSGNVAVEALDVGQGTSVLVRANGHAILADAGPRDGGALGKIQAAGVSRLDAIVVSHQHIDHMEGAFAILETIQVGRVVVPPSIHWGRGSELVRVAARERVPLVEAAAGDAFDAGPIHVDVLSPQSGPMPTFSEDLVDPYSLVLRVRIGGTTVLLPGDIRAEQQSTLAEEEELQAPVLVAPHHGSRNLDPAFVDAVDPKLTLITVGANNPYGLPAPESVRILRRHGAVFRTDQNGRVTVCLGREDAQVWTQQRR